MSPSEAIVQMGPHASAFSMFEGIIGSLGARYFPEFGFTPFTPTHITPVYFPAWIIDAEVEATVSLTDESKQVGIKYVCECGTLISSFLACYNFTIPRRVC